MKKIFLLFCLLSFTFSKSQTGNFPDFINYQAVLRDANGVVLPSGSTGTLNFKLYDSLTASNASFDEIHSYTTNIAGLVTLQIGKGTQQSTNGISGVSWFRGKVAYEIYLNGSPTPVYPRQAFATVPYAVYALSSGNGLPTGTADQTLYWNGSKWTPTSNLNNNGTNVGIGLSPGTFGNKLHVSSFNGSDSSTVYAFKGSANGRNAAFRGMANGTTSLNTVSPNSSAIYGADFFSVNNGTGNAIGVSGIGASGGTGVGVAGIATGGNTATLVGVYGSAERSTYSPFNFAALFNKGKVSIGDTLIFPNETATSGAVLTINAQRKAVWTNLSSSSPISISQGGIVNVSPAVPSTNFTISALAPIFGSTGIGTIVAGAYPNYALSIPSPSFTSIGLANVSGAYPNYTVGVATPTMFFNPINGIFNFNQGIFSTSINITPSLSLNNTTLNVGSNSINLPGLNLWARPSATAIALANINDFVGIGINTPAQKLDVLGAIRVAAGTLPSDEGWLLQTPVVGLASLRAGGRATNEMRLEQTNNAPITFWTGGTEKARITANGNVGIGTNAPLTKLHVNGQVTITDGSQGDGKFLVSDISGSGQWRSSPPTIAFGGLNANSISVSTTTTTLITPVMTFTKVYSNSEIVVDLNTRTYNGSFNGGASNIVYELRVDGNVSPLSNMVMTTNNNIQEFITIHGVFQGLSVGSHTITITAYTNAGGSSGVVLDPAGFGGKVTVKEHL